MLCEGQGQVSLYAQSSPHIKTQTRHVDIKDVKPLAMARLLWPDHEQFAVVYILETIKKHLKKKMLIIKSYLRMRKILLHT